MLGFTWYGRGRRLGMDELAGNNRQQGGLTHCQAKTWMDLINKSSKRTDVYSLHCVHKQQCRCISDTCTCTDNVLLVTNNATVSGNYSLQDVKNARWYYKKIPHRPRADACANIGSTLTDKCVADSECNMTCRSTKHSCCQRVQTNIKQQQRLSTAQTTSTTPPPCSCQYWEMLWTIYSQHFTHTHAVNMTSCVTPTTVQITGYRALPSPPRLMRHAVDMSAARRTHTQCDNKWQNTFTC